MNPSTRYQTRDAYPALREALAPELAELSDEDLEVAIEALYHGELSAEELESIWGSLSKVGRSMGKALQRAAPVISGIAQQALPVIGTVAGTAIGGPLGATLGGAAGRALSGAIGGKGNVGQRIVGGLKSAGAGMLPGALGAFGGAAGPLAQIAQRVLGAGGAGGAGGQLLQAFSRPETLKALTSMAMGPMGRSQVPVGGTQVPVSAFANMLGVLANQAAAEQHRLTAGEASGMPAYLVDATGEAIGDPLDSVSRAEVLFTRLTEAAALEPEYDDRFEASAHDAWRAAVEAENDYWNEIAAAEAEYDA